MATTDARYRAHFQQGRPQSLIKGLPSSKLTCLSFRFAHLAWRCTKITYIHKCLLYTCWFFRGELHAQCYLFVIWMPKDTHWVSKTSSNLSVVLHPHWFDGCRRWSYSFSMLLHVILYFIIIVYRCICLCIYTYYMYIYIYILYVYIYICMYVCIFVFTCMCIHIYILIYIYSYIHLHIFIYTYTSSYMQNISSTSLIK